MTLNIGFIGTGGIAKQHLHSIKQIENVSVSAFCDLQLERAEEAAKEWNNAKAYTDLTTMLDDQKFDAVYVCLPPMAHGKAEEMLIERGIPFSVEKPLGVDEQLPEDILEKIEAKKLMTSVGYQWRYQDGVVQAKELLKGQTIGMALGYWIGGMPGVPWWRVQTMSGGQFVEQTTHMTDLLRYLCGEVVEVYAAYGHRIMHEKMEGATVADIGTVTMKLESGVVATISNSCMVAGGGNKVGLDIYTNESLFAIHNAGLTHTLNNNEVNEYKSITTPKYLENLAFIHAVRTGDSSGIRSDYADAVKTHKVSMAANESAATGKPVSLLS